MVKTDIDLPLEHPYYRQFVYDKKEDKWYDRHRDIYLSEEDRILYKLPTYEELLAEKKKT